MRIVSLAIIILSNFSLFTHTQELPFYKTSEHFTVFCLSTDYETADALLEESEIFFTILSNALQHNYESNITIKISPDLPIFYESIDNVGNANLIDLESQKNSFTIINPYHTESHKFDENIIKTNKVSIAKLFIRDKYANTHLPILLQQGLALYLADYFSPFFLEETKYNIQTLSSLEELENNTECALKENEVKAEQYDDAFIAQYIAPYLFIEFIDTQWNRKTLLNLLSNYLDFENILKFLKKDIEKYWHYSVLFRTYGFKSGDHFISLIMDDLFCTFEKALNAPQKHNRSFNQEEIKQIFDTYKKKFIESDNHLVTVIQTNTAIAGWALFSLQSECNATLEAICIHPDYTKQNIRKNLITAVYQKFGTIKSIVTVNKNINVKSSYFCGTMIF